MASISDGKNQIRVNVSQLMGIYALRILYILNLMYLCEETADELKTRDEKSSNRKQRKNNKNSVSSIARFILLWKKVTAENI